MAGSKKDAFETDILELIFNNTDLANIGDATGLQGASTAGNLYVALFTTAPTDSYQGVEANYTSYARVAVARSGAGWTVSGGVCSNAASISFPACTGGSNTIVAFAICKAGTAGVDDAIFWGDLTSSLLVTTSVVPEFTTGQLTITED